MIVVSGPGGVGKGTIVDALVRRDPRLWLSRSWTTRKQRPGERDDAYVYTDRGAFERRIAEYVALQQQLDGTLKAVPKKAAPKAKKKR